MKNTQRINDQLRKIEKKILGEIANILEDNARGLADDAAESIHNHQSAGHTYGKHTASAPHYTPNSNTGKLANSINVQQTTPLKYEVGSYNVPYAKYLEYGTSQMEARPYLRPQFERYKPQIIQEISHAISQINREIK